MIDWTTEKGQQALWFIKKEKEDGRSYRHIALMINGMKILDEIVTSEQVRSAKRYHIDKEVRKKSLKRTADERLEKSLVLSDMTKAVISVFQKELPALRRKTLVIDKSKPGSTTRTEEAVLMLSSCNVGEQTLSEKISKITKEVKRLHYKQTASSRIDNLHIFMLGDIVIGMNEYLDKNFVDGVSSTRVDQMYKAVTKVAEMLINLLINFKQIHISAVCNTISREGLNWDMLFYKALEKMLVNYKDRIKFNIAADNWLIKSVFSNKFLLVHESNICCNEYHSSKAFSLLDEFSKHNTVIDYLGTAYYHSSLSCPEIREHIQNGVLSHGMGNCCDEYQYLFGVDVEGITWRYKI